MTGYSKWRGLRFMMAGMSGRDAAVARATAGNRETLLSRKSPAHSMLSGVASRGDLSACNTDAPPASVSAATTWTRATLKNWPAALPRAACLPAFPEDVLSRPERCMALVDRFCGLSVLR
jgi:hypothetical protein